MIRADPKPEMPLQLLPSSDDVGSVAHVIQLSVAPVFLLSGIAALLNVMINRLTRVIDRARTLEDRLADRTPEEVLLLQISLGRLAKRARAISWGITFCTASAILICGLVIILFVGSFTSTNPVISVAGLFVLAMLCLISGLIGFLREVYIATHYLRIGQREPVPQVRD